MRFCSAIGAGAISLAFESATAGTSGALGGGIFDAGSWARHAATTAKNSAHSLVVIAWRNTQYITAFRAGTRRLLALMLDFQLCRNS